MTERVTVAKDGFETKISISDNVAMVQVQAKGDAQDERFFAASSVAVSVQQC
jgi:hypothetical protein